MCGGKWSVRLAIYGCSADNLLGALLANSRAVSAALRHREAMPPSHSACHFEDSDHRCWQPWTGRGVCAAPASGSASALVQHADQRELCKYNPPHGFRALCRAPAANATLSMLRALRDPAVCRYRSCAVVGSGSGPCGNTRPSPPDPGQPDRHSPADRSFWPCAPHRWWPARCSLRRRDRRARRRDMTQP